MTPTAIALLELVSLTIFVFGAVAFVLLAAGYWRSKPRQRGPLPWLAVACAASFFSSLGLAVAVPASGVLALLQAFATGLIPPLLLHLQMDAGPPNRRWTRPVLGITYAAAVLTATARTLQPADLWDSASTAILAAVAALCLLLVPRDDRARTLLFAGLLLCAAGELATGHPLFAAAPDYLVLLLFAVYLYHAERLLFFDIFLKGGAWFALGFLLLTAAGALPALLMPSLAGWERIWFAALFSIPAWLLAPYLHRRLLPAIDHRILRRRYPATDAEKLFTQRLQSAATAQQLKQHAAVTLTEIFDCPAITGDLPEPPASPTTITVPVVPDGFLRLDTASRAIPFLSEDYVLLQSLAGILGQHRHALQVRELRDQATRAELRALRAQINPHFLFNALNAVAACVRSRPDVADDTLMQLAEVFRYTLRRSESEWVRLADEVHFVEAYLAVEETRFHGRLQTTVNADGALLTLSVPAMIIQPLVENAIKHGTAHLTAAGKVNVAICQAGGALRITVTDNGPGFPPASGPLPGYGLRNVAERLRGHYGASATLEWHNGADGTTVSLAFPLEVKDRCAS